MAKNESFSFDSEGSSSLTLKQKLTQWEENLTQKQKTLVIVIAVVAVVLIIGLSILITILTTGNSGGNNNNIGNFGNGGNNGNNENLGNVGGADEEDVKRVELSSLPEKLVYFVGDSPDYTGLGVYVTSNNREGYVYYEDYPQDFKITGFNSSAPVAKQTITYEYKGFTGTFEIEIQEIPSSTPRLTGITLDPAPKNTCRVGRAPSVKDAMIVRHYSDGSTKTIALDRNHLYGYEEQLMNAQVGDVVTIYVRYTEDGYVAETSYDVTVVE